MGNMIASLKIAIKSISNMNTQSTTSTKNDNYVAATLPSSLFSYLFKKNSQSPPCNNSTHDFQSRFHQVEGLQCILTETQKPRILNNSENIDTSNVSFYDSKPPLFIRKRKVKNILPIFPTNKFLFNCFACNKDLNDQDIYIYRGEWSFCSVDCRIEGIKADFDKPNMVNPEHMLSSQTSPRRAHSVTFYGDCHGSTS